jgi:hypothetical protein
MSFHNKFSSLGLEDGDQGERTREKKYEDERKTQRIENERKGAEVIRIKKDDAVRKKNEFEKSTLDRIETTLREENYEKYTEYVRDQTAIASYEWNDINTGNIFPNLKLMITADGCDTINLANVSNISKLARLCPRALEHASRRVDCDKNKSKLFTILAVSMRKDNETSIKMFPSNLRTEFESIYGYTKMSYPMLMLVISHKLGASIDQVKIFKGGETVRGVRVFKTINRDYWTDAIIEEHDKEGSGRYRVRSKDSSSEYHANIFFYTEED